MSRLRKYALNTGDVGYLQDEELDFEIEIRGGEKCKGNLTDKRTYLRALMKEVKLGKRELTHENIIFSGEDLQYVQVIDTLIQEGTGEEADRRYKDRVLAKLKHYLNRLQTWPNDKPKEDAIRRIINCLRLLLGNEMDETKEDDDEQEENQTDNSEAILEDTRRRVRQSIKERNARRKKETTKEEKPAVRERPRQPIEVNVIEYQKTPPRQTRQRTQIRQDTPPRQFSPLRQRTPPRQFSPLRQRTPPRQFSHTRERFNSRHQDDMENQSYYEDWDPTLYTWNRNEERNGQFRDPKIHQWKLTFSGSNMRLEDFLDELDLKRASRMLSYTDILPCVGELFDGEAKVWYMSRRYEFQTWGDLVKGLRSSFGNRHHDLLLMEQIFAKKQGKDESVVSYVASMRILLNRLPEPKFNIDKQIEIIKRNSLSKYQQALEFRTIRSLEQLEYDLKILEEIGQPEVFKNERVSMGNNRNIQGQNGGNFNRDNSRDYSRGVGQTGNFNRRPTGNFNNFSRGSAGNNNFNNRDQNFGFKNFSPRGFNGYNREGPGGFGNYNGPSRNYAMKNHGGQYSNMPQENRVNRESYGRFNNQYGNMERVNNNRMERVQPSHELYPLNNNLNNFNPHHRQYEENQGGTNKIQHPNEIKVTADIHQKPKRKNRSEKITQQIDKIADELRKLRNEVENFTGNKKDDGSYLQLEESITQNLLLLESFEDITDKQNQKRKISLIKRYLELGKLLEEKVSSEKVNKENSPEKEKLAEVQHVNPVKFLTQENYRDSEYGTYFTANPGVNPRWYMKVKIQDKEIWGLLDCGATTSFLNEKIWKQLQSLNLPVFKIPEEEVLVGNGNKEVIDTVIGLTINIESYETKLGVRYLPSSPEDLILGVDFIKRSGMIISGPDDAFLFQNDQDHVYKFYKEKSEVGNESVLMSHGLSPLTSEQRIRLDTLINTAKRNEPKEFKPTPLMDHEIRLTFDQTN
ncbi:hypothetical protein WDU94_005500 [Cyamophila willieti]